MANSLFNNMPLRLRLYSYAAGTTQVGINTLYYIVGSTVGSPSDVAVGADFSAAVAPFYKALQSPQSSYWGCGLAIMNGGLATQFTAEVQSSAGQGAGTVGIAVTPNQVSYVIGLATGLASRQAKGRIYPPFPSEQFQDNPGRMTAAGQVVLQLLAQFLQTPYVFNDHAGNSCLLTPQVRHVTPRVRPLPDLASYTPVSTMAGRLRFGTQRKRGQYGRVNAPPF